MTRPIYFLLLLAFMLQLSLCAGVARANSIPILEATGTNPSGGICCTMQGSPISDDPEWLGLSFSLDRPFHDLTLSVPQVTFHRFTGTAWLTTAIGTNATASDVIASSQLTNLTSGNDFSYNFFNDLDLDRGTYYFLISSPHCDDTHPCTPMPGYGIGVWIAFQQATVQAVPGVTYDGSFTASMALSQYAQCAGASFQGCNLNYDNPVASNWLPVFPSRDFSFEITRAVPEPATLLLLGGGLMVLWLVSRRVAHPMTCSVLRRV